MEVIQGHVTLTIFLLKRNVCSDTMEDRGNSSMRLVLLLRYFFKGLFSKYRIWK